MTNAQKAVLAVVLLVPFALLLALPPLIGDSLRLSPPEQPAPEVGGIMATPLVPITTPTATLAARATSTSVPRVDTSPTPMAPVRQADETPRAPVAVATPGGSSPEDAVWSFYQLVSEKQYGGAAGLWSERMRAQYPPVANIYERFRDTQSITVEQAEATSVSAERATVAVLLVERTSSGERRLSGSWVVVMTAEGWRLDQPQF